MAVLNGKVLCTDFESIIQVTPDSEREIAIFQLCDFSRKYVNGKIHNYRI